MQSLPTRMRHFARTMPTAPDAEPLPSITIALAIERHLTALSAQGYAFNTIRSRRSALRRFLAWATAASFSDLAELSMEDLLAFESELTSSLCKSGHSLSWSSQGEVVTAVKVFFRWAAAAQLVPGDTAVGLRPPRRGYRIPRVVLSAREAELVLEQPDCASLLGLRDRALMELLYSTGLRRSECIHLTLSDVDHERGLVLVREGKGRRDRLVPIGERSLNWLARYLWSARPLLAANPDSGVLFLNRRGGPILPNRLSERVHCYIRAANLGKAGSCHTFRHTMATLLLEGGADIRHIQAMLGHVHLSTTALYTRVSIATLKQVHSRAHPAEGRQWGGGPRPSEVELEFDLLDTDYP